MFEPFRDALRGFSARLEPDERRRVTATMREALVHARLALQDLRGALAATEARIAAERADLETVRRREGLAAAAGDEETVRIARRFAAQHAERLLVLETKQMAQQQELRLAEREYDEMLAQLRLAARGVAPDRAGAAAEAMRDVEAALEADLPPSPADAAEPAPRRSRADREADAAARLAELKRRMGK
jgi:hypothetical protein